MTTLMRNGRDRRSGKPVKCHAILERVLLFGTRSADYIRASSHNGCIQRPNTWLHPNASLNCPIFPLHRGRRPYMALSGHSRHRNNLVAFGQERTKLDFSPRWFVRFSNRPFGVKRFQAINHYLSDYPPLQCRCRSRARASLRNRHQGPSIMGFEDEAEQSKWRPYRQCNGRSKRTYELTSSIVPRGTSFHGLVELEIPPIVFVYL